MATQCLFSGVQWFSLWYRITCGRLTYNHDYYERSGSNKSGLFGPKTYPTKNCILSRAERCVHAENTYYLDLTCLQEVWFQPALWEMTYRNVIILGLLYWYFKLRQFNVFNKFIIHVHGNVLLYACLWY